MVDAILREPAPEKKHLEPDRDQIDLYLREMFLRCDDDGPGVISLRAFVEGTVQIFAIENVELKRGIWVVVDAAIRLARRGANCAEPVVVCPPLVTLRPGANGRVRAREGDILEATCVSVELDERPASALEKLTAVLGPPTLVVRSGGEWVYEETGAIEDRLHAHWRLLRPACSVSKIAVLKRARQLATALVGGDASNVPACHPIRLPGSWHRKDEPRLCEIIDHRDRDIDLADALYALEQVSPGRKTRSAWTPNVNGNDNEFDVMDRQASWPYVEAAMAVIPNPDLGHKDWKDYLIRIWAATNGSEPGYKIADDWSKKSALKYNQPGVPERNREIWDSIAKYPPTRTAGFWALRKRALEADPEWEDRFDRDTIAAIERAAREADPWVTPPPSKSPDIEPSTPDVSAQIDIPETAEPELNAPETAETVTIASPEAVTDAEPKPQEGAKPSDGASGAAGPNKPPPKQTQRIVSSAWFVWNFQPPDYLIDGWLQRRFIYSFTGLTGAGKTTVALRLAGHVAYGMELVPGRGVEKGKVLYLAGENPDDARMKWIRTCEEMRIDPNTDMVYWLEGHIYLNNDTGWRTLIDDTRTVKPFALVIVDTASAYFTGVNENDNVQAGNYARLLRRLTTEVPGGPTVLVPAHPTKNAPPDNLLPRGGGAFLNEMDGNLTCKKREQIAEVHWLGKFRGPEFAPIAFQLTPGTSDKLKDSKGRNIWTVTAKPLGRADQTAIETANTNAEDQVLKLIVDEPRISIADIARTMGWFYASGEPDKSKVQRVLKALENDHLVKKVGDRWEATKAGKAKAQNITANVEERDA